MLTATAFAIVAAFVYLVARWHYHAAEMADLCDMLAPRYRRDCYGDRTTYLHVAGGWRRSAGGRYGVAVAADRIMIHNGEAFAY